MKYSCTVSDAHDLIRTKDNDSSIESIIVVTALSKMNFSKFLLRRSKIYTVLIRRQSLPVPPTYGAENIVIVHGGACNFEDNLKEAKLNGVKDAAREGYQVLKDTGNPLYACEQAIRLMENIEVFNAGHGSVLNESGHIEMDASIMSGTDLSAGGVAAVKDVLHPISVARKVMEKTPHVILAGEGAYLFAKNLGLELAMPGGLVTRRARKRYKNNTIFDQKELGTVGAVSLNQNGHMAAGSSSGGLNRKKAGRVGHAARPGSGCFADDLVCAVSTSGHGESIATMCLANVITKAIEGGATPMEALVEHLKLMRKLLQNNGGAILVTKQGDLGIYFTTKRMPYAFIKGGHLSDGAAKHPEKLRKSIIACNNFNEDILDTKPLILGGENATLGEFPHMAALGYKDEATNNYKFECYGSLISDNYVLTAAYCLIRQDGKEPKIIRLGTVDVAGNNVEPQAIPVLEMYVHQNFSWQDKRNDIGIIRLKNRAKISRNVRPICLYTNDSDPDELVATGYEDVRNREGPRFLLKTYLKSVALKECNVSLFSKVFGKCIFDTQFCAISRSKPRDTCVGASGGPLQVEEKRENNVLTPASLVGVTSYGPFCGGNLPSVYTRVSKYLDWIEKIVWP